MANRKNTFLIKRSSIPGKVPVAGDLILGELALNTADVILYASGTTSNSILPIGWDRVARTGDTMTGTLYVPSISATTYFGLPIDVRVTGGTYSTGTAVFTNNTGGTFSVSGFSTGGTSVDTYVTGFTYNNANTFAISNSTGGTLSASINTVTGLTVNGNITVTGTSDFQGNFITSIIPNTNRALSLGDGTHIWQSIWGQFFRVADTSGNDVILISAPTLASSPDPAWELVLPAQTGTTFSLLGTYSAVTNSSLTTWFNLSAGTNVTLTQTGVSTGGTLSISSTDTYTTGGTYSNGTAIFTNNTGGTFSVSGFSTGGTGTDTYVTGVTISNGVLTVKQNQGQANLTASTNNTRELTFNSNDMALGTATRVTLSPIIMAVTRFDGTGAVDDAGLSFIIPNDYIGTPQFYFTWRASVTGTTSAKTYIDIYTGSTNELGSLTSSVETLSFVDVPNQVNTFLYSPTANSSLVLTGGNSIHVRIYRDPGDAGDTFTGTLDMINFNFKYNSIS